MRVSTSVTTALVVLALLLAAAMPARAQASASLSAMPPVEGDFSFRDFTLADGQSLPEVKLHYITMGTPQRDASGRVTNAVLILGGTNRRNNVFMVPPFAGELFNAGQLLDTSKYFVIIPDQFGAGQSTKPSDGLRARFPRYDYSDMVRASRRLVTEGLKVDRLRLFIGTSMGCMQGFMWAESYPDDMDAAMLLSCLPVQIASRNRMYRKLLTDAIRLDPGWNNGNYEQQPYGLRAALGHLLMVGSSPTIWQRDYPTAAAADAFVDRFIEENMKSTDANDMLYQFDASRNYDPSADLGRIKAHLVLVNAHDDFLNPGELGIAEREIKKVKNGRFVLIPVSDRTRGHYTYYQAALWKDHLARLLEDPKR